jgi:hypothetical protein
VIPVDSILGKLSLVQAGDTGTIPFESTVRNKRDSDALCEKYYPGGRADSAPGKATEPGYGIRTRGPWAGLGTCRGLCPSRRCFQVPAQTYKTCANMRKHAIAKCRPSRDVMRKHCANTAQTLRKHCTNMRKHAQFFLFRSRVDKRKHCANIAQTLRKHCANNVCAKKESGAIAPDSK